MKNYYCILFLTFCLSSLALAGSMTEAAGSAFINSAGEKKEASLSGKIVAFYFSSLRVQTFTGKLADFYSSLKQAGADFDVIFVSTDSSEAEMLQCMKDTKMPWLAVPYESDAAKALKQIKKNELKVKGLPGVLVIVKDGQVITETGKQDILDAGPEAYKKWQALCSSEKKEKGNAESQNAAAEKLPPPEKGRYLAADISSQRVTLAGKIIKVQFNRISYLAKTKKGQYAGDLRSSVKSEDRTYYDTAGISVLFPPEGFGFFSEFIPNFGTAQNDVSDLIKTDSGEVYVRVGPNDRSYSVAVGDKYEKAGDESVYKWSTKTEIPDLAAKPKVSIDDVVLFPDQLNSKTVALVFFEVRQVKQKSGKEYSALISCGLGHDAVQINFPAEGKAFFDELAGKQEFPKENSIYASVDVGPNGVITLQAKGRRASESSGDVTYKW